MDGTAFAKAGLSHLFRCCLGEAAPPVDGGRAGKGEDFGGRGGFSKAGLSHLFRCCLIEAAPPGNDAWAAQIHARFTYRMHDLGQFMKTLVQRFTRWYNRTHDRSGTLWEERDKSVIA